MAFEDVKPKTGAEAGIGLSDSTFCNICDAQRHPSVKKPVMRVSLLKVSLDIGQSPM
jgi:hypothetical protein